MIDRRQLKDKHGPVPRTHADRQNIDMRVPAYAEIVTLPVALNYAVLTYS